MGAAIIGEGGAFRDKLKRAGVAGVAAPVQRGGLMCRGEAADACVNVWDPDGMHGLTCVWALGQIRSGGH